MANVPMEYIWRETLEHMKECTEALGGSMTLVEQDW